jgi:hypothetical protein
VYLLASRPIAQAALLQRLEGGELGLLALERRDVARIREL